MDIQDIKEYLRIEHEEEDELLKGLTEAAKSYIKEATGKNAENMPIYDLAVKQLTAHWYSNRTPIVSGQTINNVPMSVDLLIKHIAICSDYPVAVDKYE